MALNFFDLTNEDVKWQPEDYLTLQLHDLKFDENGVGMVTSTDIKYDCRVVEVNESGKISRAIIQRQVAPEQYEQTTLPLRKVESLTSEIDGKNVFLETYSPLYKDENPAQRYLFTVIAGARNETPNV